MKKNLIILALAVLLALSCISVLNTVIVVNSGLVERQNALEALALTEIRVYTGTKGTIGMEGAAHPSILYRLTDAKTNNDNSLLGITDELEAELLILQQCMDSLVEEDDDASLLQEESMTATEYTFTERVAILNEKMAQVKELVPECGINNAEKIQSIISLCDDVTVNLEEIYSIFGVVVFPDPALEAVIRDAISKQVGEIYKDDLLVITSLVADDEGISDIAGLENCVNLQDLDLSWNDINNITVLEYCVNLQNLDLSWNSLRDDITPGVLSPLSGLTNLQILNLDSNMIIDFSPLSGLTNLQELRLFWQTTSTKDISPLAGLINLVKLNVGRNAIVDISPVSGLTNLELLVLEHNDIVTLSPVSGLTNLQELYLHDNEIVDISPLLDCLDSGDRVILSENPLDPATAPGIITELESRGVTVLL